MKITRSLPLILGLTVGLLTVDSVFAHEGHGKDGAAEYSGKGQLVPVDTKTDATWLEKARADYPMTTCAVSGDKLEGGDMGKPQEFIYKETGKPDEFVRFCCKDCIKDFNKEPVKYLKVIHEAAETKEKAGK